MYTHYTKQNRQITTFKKNFLWLFVFLNLVSFSYAKYGPVDVVPDMKIGANTVVFNIGRDIYSYGGDSSGNVFKYGIDENKNIYTKNYKVKDLASLCMFCFSFVMSNDSVLTLTGYDGLGSVNGSSIENNMGVYYFNPITNSAPKGDNYKILEGSPVQRLYHQAVITPNKKSVYIFGGVEHKFYLNVNTSIVQFDVSSAVFTNHGNFSFVGGTATMLPSGIVVLAFGSSNVNTPYGDALYNTSSVYLYDTNKNELYKQNVSGVPPLPRASASGTLGDNFDLIATDWDNSLGSKYLRTRMRSDLVVLNTTSWTWLHPNISGPAMGARYEHFSLAYEDDSLIIGGGMRKLNLLHDVCVLKNLPTKSDISGLDHLRWFTNSELDNDYNGDNGKLSAGAIVGIVIGILILLFIISYFLWKKVEGFREIIWKRRLGEPTWTEILRTIIRFILLGFLLGYLVYSIIRAITSPTTKQEKTEEMKKMPVPDIRVCSRFEEYDPEESNTDAFTVVCEFGDGEDCSKYFYPVKNSTQLPVLDDGSRSRSCQVFIPPLNTYFHTYVDSISSEPRDKLEMRLFKRNESERIITFYLTYYTSDNSPFRTLFKMNNVDSKMTRQDAEDIISTERETTILKNTFTADVNSFVTTTYSLTEAKTLTNSSWNYFGFGNIYDTHLDITQNLGPISAISIANHIWNPAFMVRLKPNEYSIHYTKEQRVSTILGGLASVGGVLSVIVFIQTLLFGFRPNSPWGIVHRWSWRKQRKTLRNQLRDQFNPYNSPVPMATQVRDDYYSFSTPSDSKALAISPLSVSDDDQGDGLKLRKMEDRIQLMEDLFKTYYINDEIFQKLEEARRDEENKNDDKKENTKRASGFTTLNQEDEKATIYPSDQNRTSIVLS
ncbi:hypothetical protein K501DRAFT_272618 [Backusella circina FSU 941]|nr:hypothetical protein K501DRAFT_272618 [Backusella circina FSU 941]